MVADEGVPDLVLTDLMMPGIGGAELGRVLRTRWPDLPILFMSGYSAEDLHRQGAIGANEVTIQKPFTPETLATAVAAALGRSATTAEC
jgi:CheY-like chemotaxis protein